MREKRLALVITFHSTTQAMAVERFCMEHHLAGRLIPVPREITSGCGLAWKAEPKEKERLSEQLLKAGLLWEQMYLLQI